MNKNQRLDGIIGQDQINSNNVSNNQPEKHGFLSSIADYIGKTKIGKGITYLTGIFSVGAFYLWLDGQNPVKAQDTGINYDTAVAGFFSPEAKGATIEEYTTPQIEPPKDQSIDDKIGYTDEQILKYMNQPVEETLKECNYTVVNDENYNKEVLGNNGPTMVLFYVDTLNAQGINPSRGLATLTKVINDEYPQIKFVVYKVAEAEKTPQNILDTIGYKYPLTKLPAILFYKPINGKIERDERVNGGFPNLVEYNKFFGPINNYIKDKLI